MRTRHNFFRIEQRLAHRLRDAEYLLIAVLGLMLWTAGFVDLFTATTPAGVPAGVVPLAVLPAAVATAVLLLTAGAVALLLAGPSWFPRLR